jgi:hypothetical protein
MNEFQAWDQNEPWWNSQWLMREHPMSHPVISGYDGSVASTVGHATNFPQAYADYFPSQSTVTNANVLAVPGGYAAAVRRQR